MSLFISYPPTKTVHATKLIAVCFFLSLLKKKKKTFLVVGVTNKDLLLLPAFLKLYIEYLLPCWLDRTC